MCLFFCFFVLVLLLLCFCSVYSFILFLFVLDIFSQKHLLKLFQSFEVLFIVELDSVYGRALQLHDVDDNDDDVDDNDDDVDDDDALLLTHLISS